MWQWMKITVVFRQRKTCCAQQVQRQHQCSSEEQSSLEPAPGRNFWISSKMACIAPHVHGTLRSQNKAQGSAGRCQGSRHPKGTSSLIPKTFNIFQSPPADQALISECPQWPRAHMYYPASSLVGKGGTWVHHLESPVWDKQTQSVQN